MKTRHFAVAIFMLSLHISSAVAADARGPGVETCARFLEDYKREPAESKRVYFSWAEGFMTGLNVAKPKGSTNKLDAMSADQGVEHIKTYCEAHLDKRFAFAVAEFYASLPLEGESKSGK